MTKNKPKQQRVRRKYKNTRTKPMVTEKVLVDTMAHIDTPDDNTIRNGAAVLYTTPHGGEEQIPEIYIKHLKKQLGIEDVKEDVSTTIKRVNNKIDDIFKDGRAENYCDAISLIIR